MKRKLFYGLLALEAALCVALCLTLGSFAKALPAAFAFPFGQLGSGLRALSLAGRLGNAAALALYAALCLAPAFFLLRISIKRKPYAEDYLLLLASALLFAALRLMANPDKIGGLFGYPGESGLAMGKAILGGTVYSVFIGYAILRVLRAAAGSDTDHLHRLLALLVRLLAFVFVWAAFGLCFGELTVSFQALRAGNAGSEGTLGMSYAFLVLRYLVNALPWALDAAAVAVILELLFAMRADRYSEESVRAATRLSRFCTKALAAVILSNIAFNALQLVFAKSIRNIEGSLQIPLLSIAFVLATLLFARIASENRQLKEDSDLII